MRLDAHDHAILEIVQNDNQVTHEALGLRIGLSPSSCRRRLAALRKSGVIAADVSIVDPRKIGLNTILHVLITLESDSAETHRAFRDITRATPEIKTCAYVTGPADYLVTVCVRSVSDYEKLADRIFAGPPVKRAETMVELKSIKRR